MKSREDYERDEKADKFLFKVKVVFICLGMFFFAKTIADVIYKFIQA